MHDWLDLMFSHYDKLLKIPGGSYLIYIFFLLLGFLCSVFIKKVYIKCHPVFQEQFLKDNLYVDEKKFEANYIAFGEILFLLLPITMCALQDRFTIGMGGCFICGMLVYNFINLNTKLISLKNIIFCLKMSLRYRKILNSQVDAKDI